MARRSGESVTRLTLPQVKYDTDEFYTNLKAYIHGQASPIVGNDGVRKVLDIMERTLTKRS
jgi:hypothetical protein